MTIAALIDPRTSRVFGDATSAAVAGEWEHLCRLLHIEDAEGRVEHLGAHDYLVVECVDAPPDVVRALRLATTVGPFYGFEPPDRLTVLEGAPDDLLSSSILTIQRYRGKTNERFTRLLLHQALAAVGATEPGHPASVFDPLAGRGTTVNAAVQRGLGAAAVEIDSRDHREHVNFLSNWFKDNRLKHRIDKAHVRDEDGSRLPSATFTYARTKDEFRAGRTASVELVAGDALRADRWIRPSSQDCLVTDLPYGVQHGAERAGPRGQTWSTPGELLALGLPVWAQVLRPTASVACSWNLRSLERAEVLATLDRNGFAVVGDDRPSAFEHRVDRSIQRDLVVAVRRRSG